MSELAQKAGEYIEQLFESQLGKEVVFHNFAHVTRVHKHCVAIAVGEGVSHQDQESLEIAAWFHDAGFVKSAKGHELEGKILVEEWLRANDVGEARVQEIGSLILSTTIGHKAENQLEQIISDADLSHLGTDYYLELQNVLREEMEWVKGETINAKEWCRINVEFFNKHEYYTDTARKLFGETKRQNLEAIKDMARQMEEQDPTDGGVGNPEHHS